MMDFRRDVFGVLADRGETDVVRQVRAPDLDGNRKGRARRPASMRICNATPSEEERQRHAEPHNDAQRIWNTAAAGACRADHPYLQAETGSSRTACASMTRAG